MADIELVIKVDERDVDLVRKNFKPTGYSFIPLHIQTEFVSAILNGTPLPKGHGRLIDGDAIEKFGKERMSQISTEAWNMFDVVINNAPTIIEANTECEE